MDSPLTDSDLDDPGVWSCGHFHLTGVVEEVVDDQVVLDNGQRILAQTQEHLFPLHEGQTLLH